MPGWQDVDVTHLRDLDHARRVTETRIARQIVALREQGCPWSVIGDALDLTRQGAQQRYGKVTSEPLV